VSPRAAILGTCPRSAGWAARLLIRGWDVAVPEDLHGPDFDAVLVRARLALPGLYDRALPPEGRLTGLDAIDPATGAVVIVGSFDPAALISVEGPGAPPVLHDANGAPRRLGTVGIEAHDPVYIWPSVTIAPTDAAARDHAATVLTEMGMVPDGPPPQPGGDAVLVGILRALRHADCGLGAHLKADELRWPIPAPHWSRPVETARRAVPLDWTDFNGHMTESRYLLAFADATERLMDDLGCTPDYIASGGSFFTAETHIRHLSEILAGEVFHITTHALQSAGAKLHLFHQMWRGETLLATGEHFLLHVDLETRRPGPPKKGTVAERMALLGAGHAELAAPAGAGRFVGQRP